MDKALKFKIQLKKKKKLLLGGAHDALSAKLIEEAGFDAVWASSFGVSASTKCLPDANVLTMTEMLEAVKGMNEAVSIPVIADCDNGYGNALNIIRMVKEYERAGIAGISIEDNPFPKKCSLYPGERQELVEKDEMAGRIHAAVSTRKSKDFFVIARTEALIAGLGMQEALNRATAYEEAGASAILIHSRKSTPDEIREFAGRWKGKIPLVAVPTKYPDVTSAELAKIGIPIVIFANQALRASVAAMKETLRDMRLADSVAAVGKKIVPLDEVFRLVGQPHLEANEAKYVKNYKKAPSAIIVAAGFEKNFWPLNSDKPKVMLEIHGKSLLERQVELLQKCGVSRIAVVTGYKHEQVRVESIVTYHNPAYKKTHILRSLFSAEAEMNEKFIFLYGDVLFEDYVLEKLLKSKHDISLAVRPLSPGQELRKNGFSKLERDWVKVGGVAQEIDAIGHHLAPDDANGEFLGLALFSKRGARTLRDAYAKALKKRKSRFHNAADLDRAQFTDLVQELIDRKEKVHAVSVRGGWLDINTFEDYRKAWETASKSS